MMTLTEIKNIIGNQLGVHDVACPECGPRCSTPMNRKRRVLRIWWEEAGFARFKCARCGMHGHAREDAQISAVAPLPARHEQPDDSDRTNRALTIWNDAAPLAGTPAEAYLASRGVSYQGEALRWHPSCPFGKGERHGCMIGLVRNIITNEPQAIHRTAIDVHGHKIDRKAYGPVGGGAVKLSDDADVTNVVAIGEGIETTLSIRELIDLGNMPVWSVLSANGIAAFPVLPGIETVWIAADNDASGTGQTAARTSAERLNAAGIETIILTPIAAGTDLNDKVACHA